VVTSDGTSLRPGEPRSASLFDQIFTAGWCEPLEALDAAFLFAESAPPAERSAVSGPCALSADSLCDEHPREKHTRRALKGPSTSGATSP
jgi:hypothetical protein